MQLKFKYFFGGDWNPYEDEEKEAFMRLAYERKVKDPDKEMKDEKLLPNLDSWPDYVLAASKSAFWSFERAICEDDVQKAIDVESLWLDAKSARAVGDFLKEADAEEVEKAMCYYMATLFHRSNPTNYVVDFRLYLTEKAEVYAAPGGLETLTPYEE